MNRKEKKNADEHSSLEVKYHVRPTQFPLLFFCIPTTQLNSFESTTKGNVKGWKECYIERIIEQEKHET